MENIKNTNLIPPSPNIDIKTLRPFTRFCCSIGTIPASYLVAMSYEEQLLWLCNFLENTLIPTVNNNGEAVAELQGLYIELKNYVDNYFKNLDVQEEINNKLDQMAEDGTLQEIIFSFLKLNSLLAFDTINDLQNSINLVEGSFARTFGFYEINDGGGAFYKIKKLTSDYTINNSTVFSINNTDLIAVLIANNSMSLKQFGAKSDGVFDNSPIFNSAISFGLKSLFIPDGTYFINTPININNCKTIIGESYANTIIKAPKGAFYNDNEDKNYRFISNLTIDGVEINNNIGLNLMFAFSKINNLIIKNFEKGINSLNGSWINTIDNLQISYCNYGWFHSSDAFNNYDFIKCTFQHNNISLYLQAKTFNTNFDCCNFESNENVFDLASFENLILNNCYIENNKSIININRPFFQSLMIIKNCWLNDNQAKKDGWLISSITSQSTDVRPAIVILKENYIYNNTQFKPFAFTGENGYSYLCINILLNDFQKAPSKYWDLFNITNLTNYASTSNFLPIITDLLYDKIDNLNFFISNKGVLSIYNRNARKFHCYGYFEISQTGSDLITIPLNTKLGIYPRVNKFASCSIIYDDNSIENAMVSMDASNIYINGTNKSKNTSRVLLDYYY